jgi:hypothetical protein
VSKDEQSQKGINEAYKKKRIACKKNKNSILLLYYTAAKRRQAKIQICQGEMEIGTGMVKNGKDIKQYCNIEMPSCTEHSSLHIAGSVEDKVLGMER